MREAICLYPWGHLDKQHLTDTFTFKDHWPHDLHDSAEIHLTFITILRFRPRERIKN